MNNVQKTYMLAKAHYHTSLDLHTQLMADNGVTLELYEADFDKACDLDEMCSEQAGTYEAFDLMCAAEKSLVEWGFEQVSFHGLYNNNAAMLDSLRNEARTNVVARGKIADLMLRLAV